MYKIALLFAFFSIGENNFGQSFLISTDSTDFPPVELNEVKVISSRELRNNKIVELPTAVTVVNKHLIQHSEVTNLGKISGIVPNLYMPEYGTKLTSPIYIRGIGSRINSPSVGLYVDNVPYFEKAVFDFDFFDIERIEVLRGPQGTLYGRNTMGGIINVYTRDPGKTRETDIELGAGVYNHLKGMISHIQPLGEKTSLLVNASALNYGGSFKNQYTGDNVDALHTLSGRLKLISNLNRNWKLSYSMNLEQSHQEGYPYASYIDSSGIAGEIDYDYNSSYDRFMLGNNLQLKYINDNLTLVSNTSHQFFDGYQDIDQDFTTSSLFGVVQDQQQNMIAQEITLNSSVNSKYSYLFGFFGFTQFFDSKVTVAYKEDGIARYRLPANPYTLYKSYDNVTSGAALFHQSTFNDFLINGLDMILGVRFDGERAGQNYNYDRLVGENLDDVDMFDYKLDFFEIMPKAAFSYQCAPNINTYATIARGYKAGGFNTTIEREEDETYDPEQSLNYEVGVKSDFFNRRITANVSFFFIDWINQQIYQTVPSGRGSMIKNAGTSYSKGMEAELNFRPFKNVNVFYSMGITEAKFESYEKDSSTSYSGNYIPYVPNATYNAGANYRIVPKNSLIKSISMQVNYQGFGKIYWNEKNSASQDYYGLLNANITFSTRKLRWSVWGKNLTGSDYHSFYFNSLGNSFVQLGKPAQVGTTLRLSF